MTSAPVRRSFIRKQQRRQWLRSLLCESLEARLPFDATQWLAVFDGLAHGETLEEQAQYGQDLLRSSGINEQDLRVVQALDLSGSFLLETSMSVPLETVDTELNAVPGFVFTQASETPSGSPAGDEPSLVEELEEKLEEGDLSQDELQEFDQEQRELNHNVTDQSGSIIPQILAPDLSESLANNNAGSDGASGFTQSETSLVAFGNTVVVGYNDSGSIRGGSHFTGFARSNNGGATFTDGGTLPASSTGDAGDPVLARDDRTGRLYFTTLSFSGSRLLQVYHSDDSGVTWSAPASGTPGGSSEDKPWMTVDNFAGSGNGNVYLLSRRFSGYEGIYFYRSTDQGQSFGPYGGTLITPYAQGAYVAVGPNHSVYAFWWNGSTLQMRKSTDQGLSFSAPVTVASGLIGGTNGDLYLTAQNNGEYSSRSMRSNSFPHAAVNPVNGNIYVTYNNDGAGTDKADVFMVQSTNGGTSWSAPVKINDDSTTNDQWQPTIAVTPDGSKLGIFYYSRQEDTTTTDGDPVNNQFKYYGRIGSISGSTVTFEPSFAISSAPSKPELGRDYYVNSTYMGDYNQAVATPSAFHVSWSDARNALLGGGARMDPNVYYAKISVGLMVTGSVPAAGSSVTTAPTSFTINVAAPVDSSTLQASDLLVNGIPATSVAYAPGSTSIVFEYASSPVTAQGSQAITISSGAFAAASNGSLVSAFAAAFYYDATLLAVDSTIPPSPNGVFTLPSPFTYDVIFNEAIDPASLQSTDLVLNGVGGAYVSGVTLLPGNTTARFMIQGISTEGQLTASIAAGAISDAFGNPGSAAFSATYPVDIDTAAYPTPLEAMNPLGSLIYDPSISGQINFSGDTDNFTLDIDPGQNITVLVQPTGSARSLAPTLELRDPAGTLLGSAAAAAGANVLLQTVATTTGGTYKIAVGGSTTTGEYSVHVILNAAREEEEGVLTAAHNNTLGTAQDIGGSFLTLSTPQTSAQRGAVLGRLGGTHASADFESGMLPANFTTGSYTSTGAPDPQGRIRVKTPDGSGNSSGYALMMDRTTSGNWTLNEAIMKVDLSGATAATLSFSYIQISDETDWMATNFTGHSIGDGVAISDDGVHWHTILSAPTNSTWSNFSIDLTAAAAAAGMTLGPNFQVKFQQYDDFPIASDGRGYDNILITSPEEDWYRYDLNAGEQATLALTALSQGSLNLTLVDSSGTTLATGATGPANVDRIIGNFAAPTTGTYYVRVNGSNDTDYSLVLMRNAAFDTERNDSQAQAQDISNVDGVLGAIHAGAPSVLYATANNGTTLVSIDQKTGVATAIGALGYTNAYAMAFTPDGTLWTIVNSNGLNAHMAKVDVRTGAATPIGSSVSSGGTIVALEASPSGTLYAIDQTGTLYTVNQTTGQLSWAGSTYIYGVTDLAFDQTGALWALDMYSQLFRVNLNSGVSATYQSTISGVNGSVQGLMVDPADNGFYVTTSVSDSRLYRLNPNNGIATPVGTALGVAQPRGGDFSLSNDTKTVAVNARNSGWWSDLGSHNSGNPNYFAGKSGSGQYRDFFVFDLAGVTQPITGATLVATNGLNSRGTGYVSPDPSETFTLFDVSTPISSLTASGSGQTTIFGDLGTGTTYGAQAITSADNGREVPIVLNAAGVASLNAALGTQVALGGAVTTISGLATYEQVFSFTGNGSDIKQLVLKFSSPDDWYSINIPSLDNALRLETSTPGDGPGEFVNALDPSIELYDPSGALIATGTVAADGRNEFIQYTPQTTGLFRVRVRGEDNSRGEYFLSKNLSPIVSSVTATPAIDENGVATVTGTLSDPDLHDTHTVTVNWGPGNGTTELSLAAGVTSFSASHQYLDDDPSGTSSDDYPIGIVVTDNHGASGGLATVIPTHTTELITNGGFESGDFAGWSVLNSGNSAAVWAINDGIYDPFGPATPLLPMAGRFDAVASQLGPSTQILSEAITVPTNVTSATFSWSDRIRNYAGYFSDPAQEWRVDVLGASGTLIREIFSTNPGDAAQQVGPNYRSFDLTTLLQSLPGQTIRLSFQLEGNYNFFNASLDNVSLLVTTGSTLPIPEPAVVTVNNVAPSNVVLNAGTIDENGSFTLVGSFTDPGSQDTHSVVIDWGDGQGTSTVELAPGETSFTASHPYLDDGSSPGNGTPSDAYQVRVSVTDDDQGAASPATAETSLTVNNVAPDSVAIAPAVQSYVFAVGAPQTFAGSFGDVGTLDTHTAVWTLSHVVGLSTVVETRPATVTEAGGHGTVADSFAFDNDAVNHDGPGVYTLTLTVTDDDTGRSTSQASTFVVYDPSAGFVTGGGWIHSPSGAYVADPTLTDKANFGFNSKYQKNAGTSGQMQVEFQVGDLNFHSQSVDWLVVAGARAQYQGTGTVNGAGNYGFMLTVIDGQVAGGGGTDKFRLKIWDKSHGDAVVYDNGLGAPDDDVPASQLGGGSIVVHTNGQALQAASPAASSGGTAQLTPDALHSAVSSAIASWSQAGADPAQLAALSQVDVQLADLSGELLGMASPANMVWIDVDAAGHGWNVGSAASGFDLTTVVTHELGHILGLEDLASDGDVMGSELSVGVQRMPSSSSLQAPASSLLAGGPISSGASQSTWPIASPASVDQGPSSNMPHAPSLLDALGPQLGSSGSNDPLSGAGTPVTSGSKKTWDDAILASLADEFDAALEDLADDLARSV